MNLLGISSIVDSVGKVIGDLHTSDKERMELELEAKRIVLMKELAVTPGFYGSGFEEIQAFNPSGQGIIDVEFSVDGNLVTSMSKDGKVVVIFN